MLSDTKARNAKPAAKPYRLLDGDGLHLFVTPAGTKSWRLRRQSAGKETLEVLGRYPAMGLAEARRARDAIRDAPAKAAAPTLAEVARKWHADQAPRWKPHHAADVWMSLLTEVLPTLGDRPVTEITPPMVLDCLRVVQARGAVELAHRLRQRVSAIYGYAIAEGAAVIDPAASLTRALKPVVRTRRRPALTTLDDVRAMLARAEAIPAHPVTRLALRLLALTALRPGELRHGAWGELRDLDGNAPTWLVPAARMKHVRERAADIPDHAVPLSMQAIEAFAVLRRLTGRGTLLFPTMTSERTPLSENAIGYLLARAGFHGRQTAHGLRASFSTIMNERYPGDRAVIDLMLAHVPVNKVEGAYNRAQHATRRRELAQAWADILLDGMPGAEALMDLPRR